MGGLRHMITTVHGSLVPRFRNGGWTARGPLVDRSCTVHGSLVPRFRNGRWIARPPFLGGLKLCDASGIEGGSLMDR